MSLDSLNRILADQPGFHKPETEIQRAFSPGESYLEARHSQESAEDSSVCHGIDAELASFLYENIDENSKTLETGAGVSTLIFALKKSDHVCVTPSQDEIAAIKEYAAKTDIPLGKVTFIAEKSDDYLPRCAVRNLDVVLLDGKHAFPWPIIDWYYTADRLKKNGLMLLDDIQLSSVAILRDFMDEDPRWEQVKNIGGRTVAFQKMAAVVHDVAWHMQPYITRRLAGPEPKRNLWRKMLHRVSVLSRDVT
jgi:predicted O-methyltransferase YrrM